MNSDNKQIRDVADVAARIMAGLPITEKLHPNQQKLDVHEPEKDELTADDFKKLRAGKKADVKKEEVEQIDELKKSTMGSYVKKASSNLADRSFDHGESEHRQYGMGDDDEKDKEVERDEKKIETRKQGINRAATKLSKEEVESIDEVKMADLPSTKVQGRAYGASKPEPHPLDVMKGPTEKQLLGVKSEKKKKFSEMVNLYQNGGMKSFMEALSKEEEDEIIDEVSKEIADYTMDVIDAGEYTEVTIGEEASQEEFNAEIEKAKAKSQGRDKAEVAKAAVQAVKQEEVELGEDNMNSAEMEKREKIVKGMKKGMEGFKERYGARAKNVMYATATKRAMEK
jgi:hypothetical protein